ncbi:peroxisomal biogenesis factor 11 [Hypomontagnella monticulosa]|nr:peroxisomal biogenesis factor 11 [Hypomontagnella monticulosa]
MSQTFEQLIKFTTDSVGLERTFRFFQSIVLVLSSYALPFDLLLTALTFATATTPSPAAVHVALKGLNQRLGLARRFFRLFRFLDFFNSAQKLASRISTAEGAGVLTRLHPWLDVFSRTFNGMYLLLEATTMIDALQVPGLALWTPEREKAITVEAQRFWLFALVCGAAFNVAQIMLVASTTPRPEAAKAAASKTSPEIKGSADEKTADGGPDEKEREESERLWRQEISTKVYKLGRGAVANALDTVLPGTTVGWINVGPGVVGSAMFVTTILTGMDVWERCGREVAGVK